MQMKRRGVEVSRTHGHLLDHVVGCAKADLQTCCKSDGLEDIVSIRVCEDRNKHLLQEDNVAQWQL